jgi:ribosomal protein S20
MDNDLILEINRLRVIMGIHLLNEGLPGVTADLFARFFKNAEEADRILTSVANKKRIDDSVVEDFIRIMDNPRVYDNLDLVQRRNIFKLLSNIPDLSDELYNGVLKTFDINVDELNTAVYTLMKSSNVKYKQAINSIFSQVPEVTPLIRRKHFPQYSDFRPDAPTPSNLKSIRLTPNELKSFNDIVEEKTVKTFASDILRNWGDDVDAIKSEIESYSKGFLEEIEGANKKQIKKYINAYSVRISRLLDRAEIKMNGAAAKILEESDVDEELVKKIKFADEPFFVTYKNLRGKDSQTLFEVMKEAGVELLVEVKDLIFGIFRRKGNTLIRMFDWRTSVGQFFYTNQWATINKLYRLAIKMSPGESRAKTLKYIGATMIASSIGFVIGQLIKSTLEGIWELYGKGGWNRILDVVDNDGDGTILGVKVDSLRVSEPEIINQTKNELKKVWVSITNNLWDDVIESFQEKGLQDLIMRAVPGGVLTYPESLFAELFALLTPGEGELPNIRNFLFKLFGYGNINHEDELERIRQELEGNIPTLELTVDAVKEAAPDGIKRSIWEKDGEILIGSYREEQDRNGNIVKVPVHYKVSVENNEYVVDIGTRKIKLNDY